MFIYCLTINEFCNRDTIQSKECHLLVFVFVFTLIAKVLIATDCNYCGDVAILYHLTVISRPESCCLDGWLNI